MIADPLDFARAHVRPRSLCSDVIVAWIEAHGVAVSIGPVGQLRFWKEQGVLRGAVEAGRIIGLPEIAPSLARDGDIAVATLPHGEQALGLMRANRFVTAASGQVAIYSHGIVKAWSIPCPN